MARTVLIVDDSNVNRKVLGKILREDYAILEAENGLEAMALLGRHYQTISAVLLDIIMPDMDGYAVLEKMQQNPVYTRIPVIVTTASAEISSEKKAFVLGANDFVPKPFDPDILKRRLDNLIKLRETSAMVNTLQKDKLTGIWNRETFFQKAAYEIKMKPAGHFILGCVDIDNFKVVNDQYGTQKGDELLVALARALQDSCDKYGGLCGRITADNFIALYPRNLADTGHIGPDMLAASLPKSLATPVTLSVGRYLVSDKQLSVSAMYDRACIAQGTVKGRYDVHVAVYDEVMRRQLVREQEIVNEMNGALASGQFEAWYQPQYNHSTGALIGAEALARWRHPTWGLVSPAEFIPVFERNGFVYELDKFIWEQVCQRLRNWLNEGRNPLPVSVNLSRYDLFRKDLPGVIVGLVEKYCLAKELLRLEVTESAFAQSSAQVAQVVSELISLGFTIEIDDFGSGYSSLNTLKDVPAQIIKLDMRFLESSDHLDRGGNILESIVRMSKWLGMSVIAEGVETVAQADFLKSVGCSYVQGYLYARPMPASDYEALAKGVDKEERLIALETVENLDNNAFWSPESMDTLIFNSYVGAACIFEYHNGSIELIRSTQKFADMLGGEGMSLDDTLRLDWNAHLDKENSRLIKQAILRSAKAKDEVVDEYMFLDLPGCPHKTYLRASFRVIATAGERVLIYNVIENVTAKREAERRLRDTDGQMRAIMRSMNGGVAAMTIVDDKLTYLFTNDRYSAIFGYTPKQFSSELPNGIVDLIYKDDKPAVDASIAASEAGGGATSVEFRAYGRDGSLKWIRSNSSVCRMEGVAAPVHVVVLYDITQDKTATSQLESILGSIASGVAVVIPSEDGPSQTLLVTDRYFELLGYTRAQYHAEITDPFDTVSPDDMGWVRAKVRGLTREGQSETLEFRVHRRDGQEIWFRDDISVVRLAGVDRPVQLSAFTDITQSRANDARLKLLADNISGGLASYVVTPDSIKATYFNDGFCRIMGYSREEYEKILASGITSLIFNEDLPQAMEMLRSLVRDGQPVQCVLRIHDRSGSGYKWLNIRGSLAERRGDASYLNAVVTDITKRQEAMERLRVSEAEYRLAVEGSGRLVYRYDHGTQSVTLTEGVARMFGLPVHLTNVPQSLMANGLVAEESVGAYREFYSAVKRGDKTGSMTIRRKTADGDWRWFSGYFSNVYDESGKPASAIIVFYDVSEQREKEAVYSKWQQSLEDKSPEAYTLFRWNLSTDSLIDDVQGSLFAFAISPGDRLMERVRDYALEHVEPKDRDSFIAFMNADAMLASYYRGKRNATLAYRETEPDGRTRWLKLTVELVEYSDSSDVCAYIMFENIDSVKREELLVRERAQLDPLTGVLNRAAFIAEAAKRDAEPASGSMRALMMLDVDGFKLLNDTFGHAAGDEALIDMANAIRSMLRPDDLLGRLGGDEFLVCLENMQSDADIQKKAGQICAQLRKAYSLEVQLTVSVGIAVSPRDGDDFDTLYRKADAALYSVKESGKDNYAFYHPAMQHKITMPNEMEEAAPDATEQDESLSAMLPNSNLVKRRMLIVEDNSVDLALLMAIFGKDFNIEKVSDGASALIRMRHYGTAISVVLLDLIMPGMDGYEVLEKMRSSAEMQSIPVIVVSGSDDREASLRAIRCGATDFVAKPVDPEVIRIRVQSAISKAENERLRAQNSYLSLQSKEVVKYRAALERTGTVVVEHDWKNGTFVYDPTISRHIAGNFNTRRLWRILLSDFVANAADVRDMQSLVFDIANDRKRMDGSMEVTLKTPSGEKHRFRMDVIKQVNEFNLTDKMILTFNDLEAKRE